MLTSRLLITFEMKYFISMTSGLLFLIGIVTGCATGQGEKYYATCGSQHALWDGPDESTFSKASKDAKEHDRLTHDGTRSAIILKHAVGKKMLSHNNSASISGNLTQPLIINAFNYNDFPTKHLKIILWGMKCYATAGHNSDDLFLDINGKIIELGEWSEGQEKHLEQVLYEGDTNYGTLQLRRHLTGWSFLGEPIIGMVYFTSKGTETLGKDTCNAEPVPRPTGEMPRLFQGQGANYLVALKIIWTETK